MAKIEMDISEYEIMKENKKLLENSLETERKLSEEIKKLQEEKLKALEDAKMKVVKINRTIITEHVIQKTGSSISNFIDSVFNGNFIHRHSTLDKNLIFNKCFDYIKSESTPYEEITVHGLDSIRAELREDIVKNLDRDITDKVKRAEKIFEESNKIFDKNNVLISENELLVKTNKNLIEELELKSKNIENLKKFEENSIKFHNIKHILRNGYTIWNMNKLLKEISKFL